MELLPAEVDPFSGYRLYQRDQVECAVLIRRLREIGMHLATVKLVLGAHHEEAARLVDDHLGDVIADAAKAQQNAALIKSQLIKDIGDLPAVILNGPIFATAVEQILTATTHEPYSKECASSPLPMQ